MSKGKLGAGAVGRVGLRGAPAAAERVGSPTDEPVSSQAQDVTTPKAHEATTSGASEPAPPRASGAAVARPVQYTLRLSYEEADIADDLTRMARSALGRSVDRSEVLRGLLALADNYEDVRVALLTVLGKNEPATP